MLNHPLGYRLVIFDLDGTLRRCVEHSTTDRHMPCHNGPGQWEIIPGVVDVLNRYDWTKTGFGIVTNQAGIALGYISEGSVVEQIFDTIQTIFPHWPMTTEKPAAHYRDGDAVPMVRRRFPERGPVFWYSPFAPDASSYARKPSPYMILDLVRYYDERLDCTLYVGDSPEDRQAAERAGVDFLWAWEFFGWPEQHPNTVKSHVVAAQEVRNAGR
ncbi:MAG TPA: HAD hydrolase-like protein [Alphaproteobacteria bacterium]|nr:HAD hydrolase-like protein [Alphaproteobacteria bacterium]